MRSGAEHWPHRIAVEVRCGTLASQDRGCGPARNTDHTSSQEETKEKEKEKAKEKAKEEEDKADIKSNNPHLTGGEKTHFRNESEVHSITLKNHMASLRTDLHRQVPSHRVTMG